MIGTEALLTIAEVGVAFAGFASVVIVFRRREDGNWAPADVVRFQVMISASLSVVLFAMLPFAFIVFGVEDATVWASCSAILGAYLAVRLVRVARRSLPLVSTAGLNPFVAWPSFAGAFLAIVLQVLNAANFLLHRELGPYFIGLLYLLVLSAVSFARLLPVGRARAD
jgi:hypothetical protein